MAPFEILVADDDEAFRVVTSLNLPDALPWLKEGTDYTLVEASSGNAAAELLKNRTIAVAILDVNMGPGKTGINVVVEDLERIRREGGQHRPKYAIWSSDIQEYVSDLTQRRIPVIGLAEHLQRYRVSDESRGLLIPFEELESRGYIITEQGVFATGKGIEKRHFAQAMRYLAPELFTKA